MFVFDAPDISNEEARVEAASGQSSEATRYDALVERAAAFVLEHPQGVPEEMLIGHVFGSVSAPDLWRGLLRNVLHGNDGLELGADGIWRNKQVRRRSSFPAEYVVVDVETTGLKARHHRITEIAIIAVSDAGERLVWSTLVNPERRIPRQISRLTGIDNQLVASAPRFASVAQTVLDLIGEQLIVGHNVAFDIGFLNAELRRCGLPKLINQSLDTLALADALLPELRRLSLTEVARHLEIGHSEAHRAAADAETTLSVLERLRAVADENGDGTLDTLASLAASRRTRRATQRNVSRGRSILDTSHLDGIPHEPGVYLMRDNGERVIYVGKAKDLRKRLSSYYSQPLGYTRKMDGLLESIDRIDIETTGSELEALVLESQLIRRYRPRFNSQQRNVEQYVYIKVDVANRWPTVTTSKDYGDDGARYYGPFRSARHARDAVRLINDILPLRTCRRSFRNSRSLGSPCIELSLGRCLGPCIGQASPDDYLGLVGEVLEFLEGDGDGLLRILHERLEQCVEDQDFERAGKLRDQIKRLDRISLEQAHLDVVAKAGELLIVLPSQRPGARQVWHMVNGVRWASIEVESDATVDRLAGRLAASRARAGRARLETAMTHHTVDEASIISRWIRKYGNAEAFVPWHATVAAADIAGVVLETRPLNTDDIQELEESA